MQEVMTAKVGIFRTGRDLEQAVDALQKLLARSRRIGLRSRSPGVNPELATAYRVPMMLKLALCIAHGVLAHRKPRRALPRRLPAARRRRVAQAHARHLEGRGGYPAVARLRGARRGRMELPPGWRGYGAKDYTDHPDTAARQAEVEAAKQRIKDRYELQRTLMPYEHLLPESLRGRNERVDDRFPDRPPRDDDAEPDFRWEAEESRFA